MQLPNALPIYLDYHATTPVDPRVAAVVVHAMTTAFGNANSAEHVYGEVAAALVTDARREVAALVHADYPLREKFARLTRQEERWGLYEHPTAIGTRQAWERLLAAKGVRLTGHRVTRVASSSGECCTAPLRL